MKIFFIYLHSILLFISLVIVRLSNIHLTEGELFVKFWYFWVGILVYTILPYKMGWFSSEDN